MSTLHHITADGWIENPTRPPGTVATFERNYDADGVRGVPVIDYSLIWRQPDVSVQDLQALIESHGELEMEVFGEFADVTWDTSWRSGKRWLAV